MENRQLQEQVNWMRQQTNYTKLTNQDIQQENKKVLSILKILESRLDRELQQQQYSRINLNLEKQTDPLKIVVQSVKNNENLIKVMEKDVKKLRERRQELKKGLESKLNTRKYDLEKRINECRAEVKRMKLQQNEINKKLSTRQNPKQPQFLSEHAKLQEELRVHSIKYMKILEKHNKITEQLALASSSAEPELHIPEEIYDKQIEEKEEAQFKEYQGIVKMCTILSKRNDSESNKFTRVYTQKLKELEKTIVNLGQIDRMIALKEGEIIDGKKNLELIKFRVQNGEKMDDQFLSVSQSQLRRVGYSTSRLPLENKESRDKQYGQGGSLPRRLSKLT